ncbi:MAG: peptide deformylase [Bacteroidetes bacterium]|nr:peptide deformylase [Bacteroidota bacterium]
MSVKPILQLGNPDLYRISEIVSEEERDAIRNTVTDLHDTMINFRKRYGVGRAIAAPQIGIFKQIIYMFINEPVTFINPVLFDFSEERIKLWDDCMSFPRLLVKVERHKRCKIKYKDLNWDDKELDLENDLSELLQHEYDHLMGVLAVSRAIDERSLAFKTELEKLKFTDGG